MWWLSFWRFMVVVSGIAGYLNWFIMKLWLNIISFCDSVILRSFDKSVCVLTLYLNAVDLSHYIFKINSHFVMKSWNRSVERIFTDLVIYSNCLPMLFNFDGSYDFFVFIINTGCIKMIGAVLKLIIFTSMVNRIINTSRNKRVTQQVYDTYLQMFDVCTLRHVAHIEAIVQFLPYSAKQVRCDGRGNSVLQIRYAHVLWWHKHFVLHVTPKEVVTRG